MKDDDVLIIHNADGTETRVEHPFEALKTCPIHGEGGVIIVEQKQTVLDFIKGVVYHITLPIYLWSIGMKSLDEYIDALQEN